MPVPGRPLIYHITHVDNLASMVRDGGLWPDSVMLARQDNTGIGNRGIKDDRLRLPVMCHLGTLVGQYVPFYFCPRSVMLYVISKRNHPNVAYKEGQGPVVHLVADLHEVVAWAAREERLWAFTSINAANRAADFFNDVADLDEVDWAAVRARNWVSCRDQKMAEFLVYEAFPWELVLEIGVRTQEIGARAQRAFADAAHRPAVKVRTDWYY